MSDFKCPNCTGEFPESIVTGMLKNGTTVRCPWCEQEFGEFSLTP